jgi:muramidase (phage lysozyme)
MSTLVSTDPCTNLILDFIAGGVATNPSGESAGNYNAVIGNAHATTDLSKFNLHAIANLQRQLVNNGQPSSAVGRYQIIEHTLEGLIEELSLTSEEFFTPAFQDRLAVQLLIGRSYHSWWRGRITNNTFAHNLSCEWASLPDPRNGGKSHYDGIGPNHSSTTLPAVYAMLAQAHLFRPSDGHAPSTTSNTTVAP